MQKQASFIILLLALIALSNAHCAPQGKLAEFKWILGTWQMEAGEFVFVEEWKKVNDSTYEGTSYKYPVADKSKQIPLEAVHLLSKEGEVFYVPTVTGENKGQPVYFKFTGKEKEEYVFENKEHDFPQRIIYIPVSKNQLKARAEGTVNERFHTIPFEYKRM